METGLTRADGTELLPFDDNNQLTIDSITITSKQDEPKYTEGNGNTHDRLEYAVRNIASGTMSAVHINKVWRDAGTDGIVRPDIVIKLYRSTDSWEKISADPDTYTQAQYLYRSN